MVMAVRMELLKREYVHQLFQNSIQGNLRVAVHQRKQQRILRQGHVFKAWRDYVQKKDFDYTANVISLRFLETNKRYLKQLCFDALRHEKERLKQ